MIEVAVNQPLRPGFQTSEGSAGHPIIQAVRPIRLFCQSPKRFFVRLPNSCSRKSSSPRRSQLLLCFFFRGSTSSILRKVSQPRQAFKTVYGGASLTDSEDSALTQKLQGMSFAAVAGSIVNVPFSNPFTAPPSSTLYS